MQRGFVRSHLLGRWVCGCVYSYIWAEVLEAVVLAAFEEAGGPFDAATAARLRTTIMSVGNTVDPGVAFRNFRGRDPNPAVLLKAKGFA